MPRAKQASKRKRGTKAVPALGAAGLTFSLVGGASAAVVPTQDVPRVPNVAPSHEITLGEEEISDVSLATFYVFDKESSEAARNGVQVAWRRSEYIDKRKASWPGSTRSTRPIRVFLAVLQMCG